MQITSIQNLIKSFSMFCIVLLVCIPISVSAADLPVSPDVSESEHFFDSGDVSDITPQEAVYGSEFSQFSMFVKRYEPRILTSGLLEQNNVPVYAHLGALSAVPGMGIPRIQRITVRESGTNALSGVNYFPPVLYSWDDLGYMRVRLRKVGDEKDVPDVINANLTARIYYESDVLPGLVGGAGSRIFKSSDVIRGSGLRGEIILQDLIANQEKFIIMNGKGYLVPLKISDSGANFMLFDSQGRIVKSNINLEFGKESSVYSLVRGSIRPEDSVRLVVNKVGAERISDSVEGVAPGDLATTYVQVRGIFEAAEREYLSVDTDAFERYKRVNDDFIKANEDFETLINELKAKYGISVTGLERFEQQLMINQAVEITDYNSLKLRAGNLKAERDRAYELYDEEIKKRDEAYSKFRGAKILFEKTKLDLLKQYISEQELEFYDSYIVYSEAKVNLENIRLEFKNAQEEFDAEQARLKLAIKMGDTKALEGLNRLKDNVNEIQKRLSKEIADFSETELKFFNKIFDETLVKQYKYYYNIKLKLDKADLDLNDKQNAYLSAKAEYESNLNILGETHRLLLEKESFSILAHRDVKRKYDELNLRIGEELVKPSASFDEDLVIKLYSEFIQVGKDLPLKEAEMKKASDDVKAYLEDKTIPTEVETSLEKVNKLEKEYEEAKRIMEGAFDAFKEFDKARNVVIESSKAVGEYLDKVGEKIDKILEEAEVDVEQYRQFEETPAEGREITTISGSKAIFSIVHEGDKTGGEVGKIEGDRVGSCEILTIDENSVTLLVDEEEIVLKKEKELREAGKCGETAIHLIDIIYEPAVQVAILAGTKKGWTDVSFMLHMPVEERAISLTPSNIRSQINGTKKAIEQLDEFLVQLDRWVDNFYTACLSITVLVVVGQFLKGVGEKAVESGHREAINEAAEKAEESKKVWDEAGFFDDETREAYYDTERDLDLKIAKGYLEESDYKNYNQYVFGEYEDVNVDRAVKSEEKIRSLREELFPDLFETIDSPPSGVPVTDMGNGYFGVHGMFTDGGTPVYIKDGRFFTESQPGTYNKIESTLVYKDGKVDQKHYYNSDTNSLVPYSSPVDNEKGEFSKVFKDKYDNKDVYVVPVKDVSKLPPVLRSDAEKYKKEHGDIYYAVYSDHVEVYAARGGEIDLAREGSGDEVDLALPDYDSRSQQFRTLKKELTKVSEAQSKNQKEVSGVLGQGPLQIDAKSFFIGEAMQCEEMMSPGTCKLLYNACDPVVCPPSRCDLGGKLAGKISSVQQSGLIGSLVLCAPNFPEVLVPFCLTGIQASAKMIRSYMQGYINCLEQMLEGKSVGVCDKIRSVYICEIIWRELLNPLFDIAANSLLSRVKRGKGGGEYISGVKGPMQRARDASNYFVQSYASNIFAAYKGRVSKEIGTQLCQSFIAGKYPTMGELVNEISEGGQPIQATATFEEKVYSRTVGNSRYHVYYHILAGSSREPVNYAVYLKNCGLAADDEFVIDRGMLKQNDFVDKSVEKLGPMGCKEICVNLNGEANCAFGKTVSTSWMIQEAADAVNEKLITREISKASDCVPNYDASFSASVNRQCSAIKPLTGNWEKVGVCGLASGKSRGDCWMEIDTKDESIKESVSRRVCRGKICTRNQVCAGEYINVLEKGEVCCEGSCNPKSFVNNIDVAIKNVRLGNDEKNLVREFFNGIKDSGDISNYRVVKDSKKLKKLIYDQKNKVYLLLGLMFLKNSDYETAERIFEEIDIPKGSDERTIGINLLKIAWRELKGVEEYQGRILLEKTGGV